MSETLVQSFRRAVLRGDTASVVELLRQEPRLANVQVVEGKSALVVAAGNGRAAMTKVLIEMGANVNHKYHGFDTALMAAAENGHDDIVGMLIKKGADIDVKTDHGMGMTALAIAVQASKADMVETLLEHNANANFVTERGSLVALAAYNGNVRIVRALLEAGASGEDVVMEDIEDLVGDNDTYHQITNLLGLKSTPLQDKPETYKETFISYKARQPPIHFAAMFGNMTVVTQAVLKNPAVVDDVDDDGNTLLHIVARHVIRVRENGHQADVNINLEIIRFLLDHHANLEAKNGAGLTALHRACMGISEPIIYALLDAGARLDAKGNLGETPLHLAVLEDWSEPSITALLCERGADVRATDGHNGTPLHWAACQQPSRSIDTRLLMKIMQDPTDQATKVLLNHKAEVNARDDRGWTPLRYAARFDLEKVFDLLKQHGGTY